MGGQRSETAAAKFTNNKHNPGPKRMTGVRYGRRKSWRVKGVKERRSREGELEEKRATGHERVDEAPQELDGAWIRDMADRPLHWLRESCDAGT
jgi:hypothetical protein